nr:phage holin [uncultured Agathobaculum sp.]
MNIKVRIRNPVFWLQIIVGAFVTALAYAGLTAADITTWGSLLDVIIGTVKNPYCLFLIASNIWNALNDPTTSGLKDSTDAKTYEAPKKG